MEEQTSFGIVSLVPPFTAIVLCFLTKRVLLSLFSGILVGGIILSGYHPLLGIELTLDTIIKSITDDWNARLLVFNLLMGSGVAFIWRLGGSNALSNFASKKIKTKKHANLGAWLLGIFVFFNDYVNAAIVGNAFRDIFDRLKISKEKLSYVLDSTAAPVATFFISDWIAFQIGMIQSGLDAAEIKTIPAFTGYLYSVPFNFYCILAVLMVGVVAYTGWDFGSMLKAEKRAEKTGETARKGSTPMMDVNNELGDPGDSNAGLSTFFLPILALVAVAAFGFWYAGSEGSTLMEVLEKTDPAKALLWAAFAMTATGMLLAGVKHKMPLKDIMETVIDGMKLMLLACAILVLAWSLGIITKEMHLADFLIEIVSGNLPFEVIPVILFVLSMVIAFSTGTSWGAMTILTPVAIPLVYKMTGDPYTSVTMAGIVFSGAIFGDHCSPISDTTVLSSIFSGADHMDHVTTQIPYAILGALVAAMLYLVVGFTSVNPAILIVIGIALMILLLYILHKFSLKRIENVR